MTSRHQLFEAARRTAGWTIDELWIDYVTLGGAFHVFDLDAYLAGLMPMPPGEQDVLACALNERLSDLSHQARLPYQTVLPDHLAAVLTALEEEHAGLPSSTAETASPSPKLGTTKTAPK